MAKTNESPVRREGAPHHYIKEWRKFRGLTQERLAERTPFTHGAISQLETGRTSHDMYVTPGAAPNTFRQLKKAFNWEPTSPLSDIDGQKCNLSTGPDEYNGGTRIKVRFVNRYNAHANDEVDLGAIFAAAAAAPSIDISDAEF